MSSRFSQPAVVLVAIALAGTVLVGCGGAEDDGNAPVQQRDRVSTPDAPDTGGHGADDQADGNRPAGDASELVAQALAAWEANDATTFAARIGQASDACSQPEANRRLGEVAVIAERWSSALADGRPKVQATTENQLAAIDWQGLAAACAQS